MKFRWIEKTGMMALFTLMVLGTTGFSGAVESLPEFVVDRFSQGVDEDEIPAGWEAMIFKKVPKHTRYTLEPDPDGFYLRAESEDAASGLMHRLDLDPTDFPILSWRWKIDGINPKGDVRNKRADDYAARVYVTFKYEPEKAGFWERIEYGTFKTFFGEYPPKASLNYFWANKLPKGESVWSSYSNRSRMIAVQSGDEAVGEWIREEVNVLEDYKKFFAGEIPPIQGIAIMTDTDNTGASSVAYYDDIVFRGR